MDGLSPPFGSLTLTETDDFVKSSQMLGSFVREKIHLSALSCPTLCQTIPLPQPREAHDPVLINQNI